MVLVEERLALYGVRRIDQVYHSFRKNYNTSVHKMQYINTFFAIYFEKNIFYNKVKDILSYKF